MFFEVMHMMVFTHIRFSFANSCKKITQKLNKTQELLKANEFLKKGGGGKGFFLRVKI